MYHGVLSPCSLRLGLGIVARAHGTGHKVSVRDMFRVDISHAKTGGLAAQTQSTCSRNPNLPGRSTQRPLNTLCRSICSNSIRPPSSISGPQPYGLLVPGRTGRGPGRPANPCSRGRSAAAEANRPPAVMAYNRKTL